MPLEDKNGGVFKLESESTKISGSSTRTAASQSENSQEAKLFKFLNQFIVLVSNDGVSETGERSKVNDKYISNYLRLNLLSYLRQLQQYPRRAGSHREALIQWWVTLLNFLNSDLVSDEIRSQTPSGPVLSFPDPFLSIETVSVCLECVSRLMSSLMILPMHDVQQTETFSHHILLTIHFVTNRLILNSKHTRQLTDSQGSPKFLHFLNSYSSLLRSFLGKLNAYAFFYLPDEFHYDTQILLAVTPAISFQECVGESLFTWKRRCYKIQDDQDQRIKPEDVETRDTRFFKIIISYMKNDSVFMAFYWHYWYIILRFIASSKKNNISESDLDAISGSALLIKHVTYSFLSRDFGKFNRFIRSSSSSKSAINNSFNDTVTMPDSNTAANDTVLTTEMINEFVFTHFSILRMWECLRSLSGCFPNDPSMASLLSLHDSSQLEFIVKIPAYDSNIANVVFNKILQFVIFQFESSLSGQFLHWDTWCDGILSMLRTLNSNCQVVALMCLFNNWAHLSSQGRDKVTSHLLGELWLPLTLECDFQLSKVIFFKLLVFCIVPTLDNFTRSLLKERLEQMHGELLFIKSTIDDLSWEDEHDVLSFYGNKKFSLLPNNPLKEQDLIYRAERETRSKVRKRSQNFSSVVEVANVRPSLVLRNGKYPYDVFDEIVTKAALLVAEKRRKGSSSPLPAVAECVSKKEDSSKALGKDNPKRSPSISSTIGSWFSRLSNNTDSCIKKLGPSPHNASEDSLTKHKSGISNPKDTGLGTTPSTDMLSMYSTVSSLATGRTNPSDDQLSNVDKQTSSCPTPVEQRVETSADRHTKTQKKKKKLLSPVELKYTAGIADKQTIVFLFKMIIVPCESIMKKIEKANVSWSVVTAKTYDKPLPTPDDSAMETFIEDMKSQSLESLENVNKQLGQLALGQSSNESTLDSCQDSCPQINDLFPHPDYSILAGAGNSDEEALTSDSEALLRFMNNQATPVPSSDLGDGNQSEGRSLLGLNKMYLKTRAKKLSNLLRMFNQTADEYQQFMNFLDHDSLFLEFEVKVNPMLFATQEQYKRT